MLRTVVPAGAAAAADICIEDWSRGVLLGLAERTSASHTQVLDGPTKSRWKMGLEVGYYYHAIRKCDLTRDLDPLEMLSWNFDLTVEVPSQAVGDNRGGSRHSLAKAVVLCSLQMIDCIGPASSVKRSGVCEKWLCPNRSHFFGYGPDKNWIYIRIVSMLSEVDLDGHKIALLYHLRQTGGIKEPFDLVLFVVLRGSRPDSCKINIARQMLPSNRCLIYTKIASGINESDAM